MAEVPEIEPLYGTDSDGADLIRGGDGADLVRGGAWIDEWRDGDVGAAGADTLKGFSLAEDKLAFGPGFFDGQGAPGFDIEDALEVVGAAGGWALLRADTADAGWRYVAALENTSVSATRAKIANGTIFDVEVSDVGGDGPGGLFPQASGVFEPAWDVLG